MWTSGELVINGRYKLRLTPSPDSDYVGPEGVAGWTTAPAGSSTECHGQMAGALPAWNCLAKTLPFLCISSDAFPRRAPELTAHSTHSTLEIELPDSRFRDSLDAQVAHLMMGTVDNQTRPGEPNQYPLAWLRDGAYQVVALARAGQVDTPRASWRATSLTKTSSAASAPRAMRPVSPCGPWKKSPCA